MSAANKLAASAIIESIANMTGTTVIWLDDSGGVQVRSTGTKLGNALDAGLKDIAHVIRMDRDTKSLSPISSVRLEGFGWKQRTALQAFSTSVPTSLPTSVIPPSFAMLGEPGATALQLLLTAQHLGYSLLTKTSAAVEGRFASAGGADWEVINVTGIPLGGRTAHQAIDAKKDQEAVYDSSRKGKVVDPEAIVINDGVKMSPQILVVPGPGVSTLAQGGNSGDIVSDSLGNTLGVHWFSDANQEFTLLGSAVKIQGAVIKKKLLGAPTFYY